MEYIRARLTIKFSVFVIANAVRKISQRERQYIYFFEMFDKISNVSLQSFEALKRNDLMKTSLTSCLSYARILSESSVQRPTLREISICVKAFCLNYLRFHKQHTVFCLSSFNKSSAILNCYVIFMFHHQML